MIVDDKGTIWVRAHDVRPGDVLIDGHEVVSATLIGNAFMKITYAWGDVGQSVHPGRYQLVGLRSVVHD